MISHPETEKNATLVTATGLVKRGACEISAITLDAGTGATGGTVVINDSTDAGGSNVWALRGAQYGGSSITFSKPIPISNGIYVTLSGTASRVSIAYT